MILRNTVVATLGLSYFASHVPMLLAKDAAPAKKPPSKEGPALTAASLIADMQKSVAFIAKSAKDKVNVKSKEARPFWDALKDCSLAIDQLESGVKAKDDKMIKGLDALGVAVPQLAASWGILRGSHEGTDIGKGVTALSEGYHTFLLHYGPAVARKKEGGEITEPEKAMLAKSRAEVVKLEAKLAALDGTVKPKSYQARLIQDLQLLCKKIDEVKGDDVKAYNKFAYQFNRLSDTCTAYDALVKVWYPESAKAWASASSGCETASKSYATASASYYKDWDYTAVEVTNYGSYYSSTSVVSSITTEEETSYESSVESYSEESATEESSEESSEINEEVSVDEDEKNSLAEEVEDGAEDDSNADEEQMDNGGDADDDGDADDGGGSDDDGDGE
jgi:hypothetical protein